MPYLLSKIYKMFSKTFYNVHAQFTHSFNTKHYPFLYGLTKKLKLTINQPNLFSKTPMNQLMLILIWGISFIQGSDKKVVRPLREYKEGVASK